MGKETGYTSSMENINCRDHVKLGWQNRTKKRAKLALQYLYDHGECAYFDSLSRHYTGEETQPDVTLKAVLNDIVALSRAVRRANIPCAYLEKNKAGKSVAYSLHRSGNLDILVELIDSIPTRERKDYVRTKKHNTRSEEEPTEGIETIKSCGAREDLIRDRATNLYGIALKDGTILIEPTKNLVDLFSNYDESRKLAFLQTLK
jgi:hypothetical protein